MKKAFLLLELIFVILIIAIIYSMFTPKKMTNKLDEVTNRIYLYLNFVRHKALVDDKYSEELNEDGENLWHKRRWTMKFFRCRENEGGGIYFIIYSEKNDTGQVGQKESLRDPLTNKYIYSSNYCKSNNENSKYVLLKDYGIKDVQVSCNTTTSLGQISFGEDGKVYSQLSNKEEPYEYEITQACSIKLIFEQNEFREILIHPKTAFIELLNKK